MDKERLGEKFRLLTGELVPGISGVSLFPSRFNPSRLSSMVPIWIPISI